MLMTRVGKWEVYREKNGRKTNNPSEGVQKRDAWENYNFHMPLT